MARRLAIKTPKELVLVDNKPVIEYGIDHLIAAGVNQVVVIIREGKEAVKAHLTQAYPQLPMQFIYQNGPIGNLIHAIQAAYTAIQGHTVYFCMADVMMAPNPFSIQPDHELSLLCQRVAGDQWRHLGVINPVDHCIVDKPTHYVSNICWGALIWRATFTEKIMQATDLTSAMNKSHWSYHVNIEQYVDIGIDQKRLRPLVAQGIECYEFVGQKVSTSGAGGYSSVPNNQAFRHDSQRLG
jgi:dTDP-glucose pyrophosphorylase